MGDYMGDYGSLDNGSYKGLGLRVQGVGFRIDMDMESTAWTPAVWRVLAFLACFQGVTPFILLFQTLNQ